MNEQLLLDIIKAGGQEALYLLVAYQSMSIIENVIMSSVIIIGVYKIIKMISEQANKEY